MESKGSRKQAANKLQSTIVQNQTIQSNSGREAARIQRHVSGDAKSGTQSTLAGPEPVVVRCDERIIKGYLESPEWNSLHEAVSAGNGHVHDTFRIRHLDSDVVEEVPASDVKAIFFVGDLDGEPDYKSFRFHAQEPILSGVWVQVQFRDGEIIEGVVENSIRHLTGPGFFLRPTDPDGNNKLVYVIKNSLVEHHVLGLTQL